MERHTPDLILIVNDAPDQLALASIVLRQAGYPVETARDGQEGLERARQLSPALVVSDVNMPRLDGIELCRALRADVRLRRTPVLLVSALRRDTESVVAGLEAGAEDYLEAPYEPPRLVAKVTRTLERAHAEAALRDSEEKFRTLSEASFEGIAIHDQGRIVECNSRLADLFGYRPAEMLGAHFLKFTAPESRAALTHKATTGDERPDEATGVKQDGTEFPVEIVGKNIFYRGREMRVVVVRDLTARKRNEATLRARTEADAESEKMRSLGQLAAGVAHNFNNALAAILGRTQLLLRGATDEQLRSSLQVIETASLDAAEIVRRIQTFSRRAPAETSGRVSLAALVQDAIQLTRTRWENEARAHGLRYDVRFTAHVAAGEDFIAAHASELREVFVNLILNALDAMPAGGAVEITESYANGEIVIEVRDEGAGIPPELLDRIFEPFFTTKGSQGSGLGLALSYSVIDRHGGTLGVTNHPPHGATFTIRFPRTARRDQSANSLVPGAQLPAYRVLVVDDDEEVRHVLVELLQTLNQEVTGASDADAALAALAAARFDILLTDLSMPHTDGLTLAAHVRRHAPHIRIILSTGYGQSLPGNPLGAGLIDYAIEKPFDISEVKAALQAISGQQ